MSMTYYSHSCSCCQYSHLHAFVLLIHVLVRTFFYFTLFQFWISLSLTDDCSDVKSWPYVILDPPTASGNNTLLRRRLVRQACVHARHAMSSPVHAHSVTTPPYSPSHAADTALSAQVLFEYPGDETTSWHAGTETTCR